MIIGEAKKTVLLFNPPGTKMYLRDYYCSKVSKARYYYHPIDLVYLSGTLSEKFEVNVLDAIVEKLSPQQCITDILKIKPYAIIFLSSGPSFYEDQQLLAEIKERLPETLLVGTGDIFRENKYKILKENKFLDAMLMNFSTTDILKFLSFEGGKIPNIIYRGQNEIVDGGEKFDTGQFDVATPRWELFKNKLYSFPFAKHEPFATILTDFGCPFNCDFCQSSSLGFKLRSISSVIKEMLFIKSMGIRELYFRDQTFGANHSRTIRLLQEMISLKLNFSWTCLSRVDLLDNTLLEYMKLSGCHTIMVGIESASDTLMKVYKKNTTLKQAKETIYRIKKAGIRVGGFFMIGFPGESLESIHATSKLARKLSLDYASFNIVTPRFGTTIRETSISGREIDANIFTTESSQSIPIWNYQQISNSALLKCKKDAVNRFYLRPLYLLKRIISITTVTEIKNLFLEAIALFKKNN